MFLDIPSGNQPPSPFDLLADDMLAGCKLSEPIKDTFLRRGKFDGPTYACALGAALLGSRCETYDEFHDRYSILRSVNVPLRGSPCSLVCWIRREGPRLDFVIEHLNDHHAMPREEIAEWVRSLQYTTAEVV